MIKKILDLQNNRFFVIRYSIVGILFIWHIWPQFIHDFARPEIIVGTEYMVLLDELMLNVVILFMLMMYPLANAIVERELSKQHIANICSVFVKRFVISGRQLMAMRDKHVYNYKRDGWKPLAKQLSEVLLWGLAVAVMIYVALVFFILLGWLIILIYLGVTELPSKIQNRMSK